MKRTISFGKVDYNHSGRKNCLIEVELQLRDATKGPVFTVCVNIWNPRKTDLYCGGQCLDKVLKYLPGNKLFAEIYRLWKLYHLNDMHAGTAEQEAAVNEYCKTGRYDYTAICEYLKSIGLYEHNGYRYGSAWLYREIPAEDLEKIKEIIETGGLQDS